MIGAVKADDTAALDALDRVLGVLRRTAVDPPDGPWTHVVTPADGGGWRARVTDAAAARALYAGVARLGGAYTEHGIAVLERRLSNTVRLSVELELDASAASESAACAALGRIAVVLAAPWGTPTRATEDDRRHACACLVIADAAPPSVRACRVVWLHCSRGRCS